MILRKIHNRRRIILWNEIFLSFAVYCLRVEIMQIIEKSHNFRPKAFPPKLTEAEVITIEICGEFFKLHEDTEIYNYFRRHYPAFFPNLPSRTTFVRQSANLWQAKVMCQSLLVQISEQTGDLVQSIDTLPLPVCTSRGGGFRRYSLSDFSWVRLSRRQKDGLLRFQTRTADCPFGNDARIFRFCQPASPTSIISEVWLKVFVEQFRQTKVFWTNIKPNCGLTLNTHRKLRQIARIWKVLPKKSNWSEKPNTGES